MRDLSRFMALACLLLSGCSTAATSQQDDVFTDDARALGIVLVNHTDRYVSQAYVGKYWAANIGKRYEDGSPRGGNSSVCCYSGVTDWRKPVRVAWTWGREEEPGVANKNGTYTPGKMILPDERHEVMAKFPPRFPLDSPDRFKQETALCVIFRDLNTVDLAYSVGGFDCDKK
ncbi:DUF3304 domain-containing protein [Chromobacterium piscinae]|uniref:DUF3304 domain-containing protein n=1 Tax=Chromobacterium piscinae TaxID=686831 RepID=UPI003209076F